MLTKIVVLLLVTLSYVFLLTVIFEYCINEASSNLLTATGILLFIFLTLFYIKFLLKTFKKQTP